MASNDDDVVATVQPMVPALRRYARALLRDADDADDLVQDVLERAMLRWHQRRPAGSARSWLFAILHNLAVDRLRRRARRGADDAIGDVPEARLAVPADQEASLERRDILALLARLPEEQRAVLLLVAVEDLSYAETAAVLGIAQGTVMSRLSRGRERMRRMVEEGADVASAPHLRIVS